MYDRIQSFLRKDHQGLFPIFENSFPKSGTHLLKNILLNMRSDLRLSRIGEVQPFHFDVRKVDRLKIEHELSIGNQSVLSDQRYTGKTQQSPDHWEKIFSRATRHDLILGHIDCNNTILEIINKYKLHHVFIYRDPRDVVISRAHYAARTSGPISERAMSIYFQQIKEFDARVKIVIMGNSNFPPGHIMHFDIDQTFRNWLGWLNVPGVLAIKYEDLISQERNTRLSILHKLCEHCDLAPDENLISNMEKAFAIKPNTFRKGIAGSWKSEFSPENKSLFKEIAGNLLIEMGYEKDNSW